MGQARPRLSFVFELRCESISLGGALSLMGLHLFGQLACCLRVLLRSALPSQGSLPSLNHIAARGVPHPRQPYYWHDQGYHHCEVSCATCPEKPYNPRQESSI